MLRFALLLAVLSLAPTASAQITFEPLPMPSEDEAPDAPIQGRPVRITLQQPASDVRVVWRPNSAIPDTVSLDPSATSFVWTPSRAGVARIMITNAEGSYAQNVSVRYSTYPAAGIFILIIAGTILFGGAGFAMGKLLGGERPASEIPMPMDT